MGTRADLYVGRGEQAEWMGSFAWDGYPDGPIKLATAATTEEAFRFEVATLLRIRRNATTPDMGWPWPWENSRLTDYAYAFDNGKVWCSSFGRPWFDPLTPEPEEDCKTPGVDPCLDPKRMVFPDMKSRQKVTLGERSGLIVLTAPKQ